jgi:hypothetical protein
MVRIAGSDIPNLSKIVENTFDSVVDIYNNRDINECDELYLDDEFDDIAGE